MSNYPTVRPSLTLDFQKSKQLDPRISFSRSSSATYVEGGVIKNADEHQARFEDEGLLIEESRTNYTDNSVAFTDTGGGTLVWTANATTSPDGTTTAYKSVPVAGFVDRNTARLSNLINGTGSAFTGSVFVKKETLRYAHIAITGSVYYYGRLFDLDTGTFVDTNSYNNPTSLNSTVESFSNGWYRISISRDTGASETAVKFSVGSTDNATPNYPYGQVSYVADGTSGMYFWGAQLEAGFTFPTSYIPTTGSTVTRSKDIAQITGDNFSSWYNTSESTWYVEGVQMNTDADGNQTGRNSLFVDRYANIDTQRWTAAAWRGRQGSSAIVPVFATPVTPKGSTVKTVYAIDGTNAKLCVEGVLSSTGTLSTYPQNTELRIGRSARLVVNDDWRGHISRIAYYSRRLTDSELQTITL